MIPRFLEKQIIKALEAAPVVAILGARQVGKTTLAFHISRSFTTKKHSYLDLELDSDLIKLSDAESYLRRFENKLLIIDEIQRKPDLFRILRGLIDIRKRSGEAAGHFLLLGSASRELLQTTSETLAGRIRYLELGTITAAEFFETDPLAFNVDKLWFRGGFPDSLLAVNEKESWNWRGDFIRTYVQQDIPLLGPGLSSERLRRFWTMLAHYHGQQVNFTELGRSLEVSHTTVRSYLDTLSDFYMVRQIQPWSGNTKKRLVKSPKIYLRDSGLLHRLLNLSDFDALLGHPIVGSSWEGFVTENILLHLPDTWRASFYRTNYQHEIDLILEGPSGERWAVEIKRSASPVLSKGFHKACEDIEADRKFVVYSGTENFSMGNHTEATGLITFLKMISSLAVDL